MKGRPGSAISSLNFRLGEQESRLSCISPVGASRADSLQDSAASKSIARMAIAKRYQGRGEVFWAEPVAQRQSIAHNRPSIIGGNCVEGLAHQLKLCSQNGPARATAKAFRAFQRAMEGAAQTRMV